MSTFRILSIDGGGIRGIIPAFWLARLEERLKIETGRTLRDVFDLFAGTSTGSIIAAGLATGKTAQQILDLYMTQADRIFPKSWFVDPRRYWSSFRPGYDGSGLDDVLTEQFGTKTLGEVDGKRLLITSFNAGSRTLVIFDSDRPDQAAYKLADCCRASSSAPTYFPAKILTIDGEERPLLDGGMAANNPAALALAKAFQADVWPYETTLVSLGTGATERPLTVRQGMTRGIAQWAKPIVGVCFDGSSATNEELIRKVLPKGNYFRFQKWNLGDVDPALDRTDVEHLRSLRKVASDYLENEGRDDFDGLVDALGATAPPSPVAGRWKSEYTWSEEENGQRVEKRAEDEVELTVTGNQIGGKSVGGPANWQYSLEGKIDGYDIEGTWRSRTSTLHGVFYWRLSMDTSREILGYWIGKGDNLFVGEWRLTRMLNPTA